MKHFCAKLLFCNTTKVHLFQSPLLFYQSRMNYLMTRSVVRNVRRLSRRLMLIPRGHLTAEFPANDAAISVLEGHGKSFSLGNWRIIHSNVVARFSECKAELVGEIDETVMNDFLSRFVAIMRGKICEVYPDCDKSMVDSMLVIIVQNVVSEMEKGGLEHMVEAPTNPSSAEFSEDLWKTVWEVSGTVLQDMAKEGKKEKMKKFLQCEEVTQMCKFAGEIGIRGDMLRELRFKWAKEKMEEAEFYDKIEKMKQKYDSEETSDHHFGGENPVVTLPKRRGELKYKIYGLDLSDPTWRKAADAIGTSEETVWPQEPKEITGRCKLVQAKIMQAKEETEISSLLAEYKQLLEPRRVDWMNLLDTLKTHKRDTYLNIAEMLLNEETYAPRVHDYSTLIDIYTKSNRLTDAERILQRMNDNGIVPDMLTTTILIGLFSKMGNIGRAKEAFRALRSYGFLPDANVYKCMILAYVKAGQPKEGELLIREMEARDMKPTRDMYVALLDSFSQKGDVSGANQIANTMQFAGFELTRECFTLLVEAYGKGGGAEQARAQFDYMVQMGLGADDRAIKSVVRGYERKNMLDEAVEFLIKVEKEGGEVGCGTYTVLVDWMAKMQLVDEAEEFLKKIEERTLEIEVIVCAMYARAGDEARAREALKVVERNQEKLSAEDFERTVSGLVGGGLIDDAVRLIAVMEARGFAKSESLSILMELPRRPKPKSL